MAIRGKFGRAVAMYQNEGWSGISRHLVALWNNLWGYRVYNLYVLEIDRQVSLWPPRVAKLIDYLRQRYVIEWSGGELKNDLPAYLQRRPDVLRSDLLEWIASGHRTVIVHSDGTAVGDCWLAMDKFPLPSKSRKLARWMENADYAFSYMAMVEPRYRGFGVFPLLLAEQLEYARNHGKKGLMGVVLPRSQSSRESLETMGFENRGALHIIRIFGMNLTRVNFDKYRRESARADQT